jgi:hypothetical protein
MDPSASVQISSLQDPKILARKMGERNFVLSECFGLSIIEFKPPSFGYFNQAIHVAVFLNREFLKLLA